MEVDNREGGEECPKNGIFGLADLFGDGRRGALPVAVGLEPADRLLQVARRRLGVDRRRLRPLVPEQARHRGQVLAGVQDVRGEGVAQDVGRDVGQPGP